MSKERAFKGVWIPKEIWLNPDLSPIEKLFLAEIDSLDNDEKKGCFASNEYFGNFFKISEGRAANIISGLRKRGYIVQVYFDGTTRGIRLHENVKSKKWLSLHENVKAGFTKRGKQVSRKREHNIDSKVDNKVDNKDKDAAKPLTPPFEETGETTDLDGTLEAQQPEPTSPGGGAPGAIRVSITAPEHPDITVQDVIEPKTDAPKTSRGKSKNPRSGTQDEIELAMRVIEHLNKIAGRSFRVNTGENARGIIARHREGFTEAELMEVVEFKAGKWKSDPEMYEYLNPVTLFRPANFERYLQAARAIAPKPQQQTTRSSIQHFGNGDYSKKQAF